MGLTDDATIFISSGRADEESDLLLRCVNSKSADGLRAVQMLFEDMYGGITYNFFLKAPPAYCLVAWGLPGLEALLDSATRIPTSKNQSLAVEVLATLAGGSPVPQMSTWTKHRTLDAAVHNAVSDWPSLYTCAKRLLRQFVLSFDNDEDIARILGAKLGPFPPPVPITKPIFDAMAARWMALSDPVLEQYGLLLREKSHDEAAFQAFFTLHPQLLDPMALAVWPTPTIHGAREPDFVIRRTDDSFVIVEIETPTKPLITQGHQRSAPATHAIAQAVDYRAFLASD